MTITDEMVERAAKAMQNQELDYPMVLTTPDARTLARAALLAALGETHVVVPREPTDAMRSAGADWANYDHVENPDMTDIDKFVAQRVYGAMIAAAVPSPERGDT